VGSTEVRLRDNRAVVLRALLVEDSEKLFEMYSSLSEETLRWAMPPYTREIIDRWMNNLPHCITLVAVYGDRIVGHATVFKSPHPRRKGVADFGIYIHQDFQNVGLGTAMVSKLLESAKKERLHRLELGVIAENTRAVRLYKKFGFEVEGVSKDWYFGGDGKYHDFVAMGLILE
jgi:putative acetyltransferase